MNTGPEATFSSTGTRNGSGVASPGWIFSDPEYVAGVSRFGLMPAIIVPGVVPPPPASSQLPPDDVLVVRLNGSGVPALLMTAVWNGGSACPTCHENDIPNGFDVNVADFVTFNVTLMLSGLLFAESATIETVPV